MKLEMQKYEDIYERLKKCFEVLFGNDKKRGKTPLSEVQKLVNMRKREDFKNNLPENSLIEVPKKLFEALKETYISRDYISGFIGCAETPAEQLDGITNMALLMYLSNHLSKQYKIEAKNTSDSAKREKYKKNEADLLKWKNISLTDIIASIYVLEKTSEEYNNYFSYGNRLDDNNAPTFVIDVPYIGQLCVHFGGEENKNVIIENAQNSVKSILQKKLELGQITEEQLQDIISKLESDGVLPEYEGKLYEYVGAMPIEYIGEKTKKYRALLKNKLPEDITSEDIKKMSKYGLNERELYYFFIKMGAPKDILNEISGVSKKITPKSIESSTDDITMQEFKGATQELKNLVLEKEQEKIEPNIKE